MLRSKIWLFAAILFSTVACIKEPKIGNYEPTIAIPLVDSKLTVFDILARTDTSDLIVSDPVTKLLALSYKNSDLQFVLQDIYDPQRFDFATTINFGSNIATTTPGGQITFSGSVNIPIGNAIDLYSGTFSQLTVNTSASSTFQHPIDLNFTLPSLIKNSQSYSAELNLPIQGSDNQQDNFSPSSFSFEVNGNPNLVPLDFTVTINTNGAPITSNDAINLNFAFENLVFENLVFNPGELGINIPEDSVLLKLFRNSQNADIEFDFSDPQIFINIDNGFEIPFEFTIDTLTLTDAATNETTQLLLNNFQNPFIVQASSGGNNVATTSVKIDKSNSNIGNALTPNDKLVRFALSAKTDVIAGQRYNVNINDAAQVNLLANLPLKGYLNNYVLSANVDINLSEDPEEIKEGGLRYTFINKFPVGVIMQVSYEVDGVTKTLFDQPLELLAAPPVDGSGKVTEPRTTNGDINLSETELTELLSAKKLKLEATISTTDADQRKQIGIFLDNEIEFKLGLKAKISLNQ